MLFDNPQFSVHGYNFRKKNGLMINYKVCKCIQILQVYVLFLNVQINASQYAFYCNMRYL